VVAVERNVGLVAVEPKRVNFLSGLMRMKRLVLHKHERVSSNGGCTSMKGWIIRH
jgi:hypothetical protein